MSQSGVHNLDQGAPAPSGGRIPVLQDVVLRDEKCKVKTKHRNIPGDITLALRLTLDTLVARSKRG